MTCEACKKPVRHVRKQYTPVKVLVTAGLILTVALDAAGARDQALLASILTNLIWVWE